MKRKLLMLLSLSVLTVSSFADNVNFGYINVDRIMADADSAKTISTAIKAKFQPQQDQLLQMSNKLMREESSISALQDKATTFDKLSKSDQKTYKSLMATYDKDKSTFMDQYSAYQKQLSAVEEYALAAFLKQSYQLVKAVGTEKGIDLILSSDRLIYANSKYDITDQVLSKVNKMDVSGIVNQIQNGSKPSLNAKTN